MQIKDIFNKPIDRELNGVIKVGQDDEASVKQELEEYVVTNELKDHFKNFFDAYRRGIEDPYGTSSIGVRITGFFGSGKSHFLKILSYLLENREVDGKSALDYFIKDGKIQDEDLKEDMEFVAQSKTETILFNIDSKSNLGDPATSLISAFYSAFNEHLGYSSSNPSLADLERNLDKNGKYEAFKRAFEVNQSASREDLRDDFDFIQAEIGEALAQVGFMNEEESGRWFDKAMGDYHYNIEDFANLVKDYLDYEGPSARLVFLVDEMGQFIGENTKLMLNLQTLTEDLGIICQGRAWIVVTSQQDIDSITKVKSQDYSKIQGRFATKLTLTSANVDEVIKKRILEKNQLGEQKLLDLYKRKRITLLNILTFKDKVEKKTYAGSEDFAEVYPFVNYQFDILGSILTSIRLHGASGKHLAEGERSMLSFFKEACVSIMDQEIGALVPLNLFYDAIEQFLDSSHAMVIKKAQVNSALNPFDIKVLKVLFLIKYVKEVSSNVGNITTLLIDNVECDRDSLQKKVQSSLERLKEQTLIQENADLDSTYVFLTNEEQELNLAIKNEEIDVRNIYNKIGELIFEDIYEDNKFHYKKSDQGFFFNREVGEYPYKKPSAYDLTVKVLLDTDVNDVSLQLSSSATNTLYMRLSETYSFKDEISEALQIEQYLNKNQIDRRNEELIRAKEKSDKIRKARTTLEDAIKNADFFAGGKRLEIKSAEAKTKINEALKRIIGEVYSKLYFMPSPKSEKDIEKILKQESQEVFEEVEEENHQALDDLRSYLSYNDGASTKLRDLKNHYQKPPYGFGEVDVEWLVASLFRQGDLIICKDGADLSYDKNNVKDSIDYLTKKTYEDHISIRLRERADIEDIKKVAEIASKVFDTPRMLRDEGDLVEIIKVKSKKLLEELEKIKSNYDYQNKYPGKDIVDDGIYLLEPIENKKEKNFFSYIMDKEEDLLDFKSNYIRIKEFFYGDQKTIFDDALKNRDLYKAGEILLRESPAKTYAKKIREILNLHDPFDDIYTLKEYNEEFDNAYGYILKKEKGEINLNFENMEEELKKLLTGKTYEEIMWKEYNNEIAIFKENSETAEDINILMGIKDGINKFWNKFLEKIYYEEEIALDKIRTEEVKKNDSGESQASPVEKIKKKKFINFEKVIYRQRFIIRDEKDLDNFTNGIKKSILDQMEEDTDLIIILKK